MSEQTSYNLKFFYGDVAADFTVPLTGWTEVGNVVGLKLPEAEASDIDSSDFATKYKTYISGMIEGGEAEAETHYTPAVYKAICLLHGVAKRFKVTFSDGSGIGWNGYVKKPFLNPEFDGLVSATYVTKVSGQIVVIDPAA